ncbi:unnamed protein product [Amoebophrya sp. A25]|nr:unnamed protein product [Amoebophrya sp. A25]|eukprot:GSA25T00018553001.1
MKISYNAVTIQLPRPLPLITRRTTPLAAFVLLPQRGRRATSSSTAAHTQEAAEPVHLFF